MLSKVFYIIFILFLSEAGGFFSSITNKTEDTCFCQLRGILDDCSCSVDTVDYFNNVKIYPRLQSLLMTDYFRFYKVNLKTKCPFWSDDSRCAIRYCHIEACLEEDIPHGLKGDERLEEFSRQSVLLKQSTRENCDDHDNALGYLNKTISESTYKEFDLWKIHDDAQDNFCVNDNDNNRDAEYVDLSLNPERYTGYKGPSAHRIWRSIYMENCFRPKKSFNFHIIKENLNNMCLEKRVFYRVISGLHASINIHLSSKFLQVDENDIGFGASPSRWGPNLEEFKRRFDAETTKGEGPQWLRNLYFVYLLELRALHKAAPYLLREEYYTGNSSNDQDVRSAMQDLLNVINNFPDHFNESLMFIGGYQSRKIKEEFRQHFRNISRIMDCVGCDKCKLWGKLQIQGLGTALKILFSGKFDTVEPTGTDFNIRIKNKFYLERSEIVALLNAFGRLSTSIRELEEFRRMM